MSDKKRYYWLKLKEDFFDEDAMSWLEEQPNGKEYCLFYLKLCLKSLKCNGTLIRQVGNMMVPYNLEKLSEITRTNKDTVIIALHLLEQIGLVSELENGVFYMNQLENMVGSESKWAQKKRMQRKGDNVPKLSQKCPTEYRERDKEIEYRDKEIDKEIELDTEIKKKTKKPTAFDGYTENGLLSDAIKDFISMRKQIKAPMTDRAVKLMLQKLDTLASDDETKIAILNQSILNSWKGIFPIKEEKRHDRVSARDDGEESIDWSAFDGA